jgi:nucleotide-binding universal stress UspA family protein
MWKEPAMYRAIMVPLDGSAFGEQALPVALSIREHTQVHDVDLIAMATQGYGGVPGLLLGSVADAVVHMAV